MDPTGLGVATMQTSGKCCEAQKLKAYVRRKANFWCLYSTLSIHVQLCTC